MPRSPRRQPGNRGLMRPRGSRRTCSFSNAGMMCRRRPSRGLLLRCAPERRQPHATQQRQNLRRPGTRHPKGTRFAHRPGAPTYCRREASGFGRSSPGISPAPACRRSFGAGDDLECGGVRPRATAFATVCSTPRALHRRRPGRASRAARSSHCWSPLSPPPPPPTSRRTGWRPAQRLHSGAQVRVPYGVLGEGWPRRPMLLPPGASRTLRSWCRLRRRRLGSAPRLFGARWPIRPPFTPPGARGTATRGGDIDVVGSAKR